MNIYTTIYCVSKSLGLTESHIYTERVKQQQRTQKGSILNEEQDKMYTKKHTNLWYDQQLSSQLRVIHFWANLP